jgi:hypothetical protein
MIIACYDLCVPHLEFVYDKFLRLVGNDEEVNRPRVSITSCLDRGCEFQVW